MLTRATVKAITTWQSTLPLAGHQPEHSAEMANDEPPSVSVRVIVAMEASVLSTGVTVFRKSDNA